MAGFSPRSEEPKLHIQLPSLGIRQWKDEPPEPLVLMASALGFPGSSAGKEHACNAGDPSSIPGSGGSPGEGIGYPLHYSWASLVVQTVQNSHTM